MSFMSDLFVSSPHGRRGLTTNQIMRLVCYATVPGLLTQIYFFGWGVLIQALLCIVVALATEALVLSLREKPVRRSLGDGSAVLTGLLLAISIPPLAPWWVSVIGVAFAIIIVKQLYGGMGFNLFNPAMAGYVVLLISFPVAMTNWLPISAITSHDMTFYDAFLTIFTGFSQEGYSLNQLKMTVDGVTMATPLDHFKTALSQGLFADEIIQGPIYGDMGGAGWQWVNLAYLIGGLFLMSRGVIRWHIPVAMLATLLVLSVLSLSVSPDHSVPPMMHLFSGATMLAAFFIATDPVSASTTPKGRLFFGALIGLLIFVIRQWGGYPDGVAFAVLLANMCVPLIDHYTQPVVYGHKRKQEA